MKRSLKNIVMLALILIVGTSMFFTVSNLKPSETNIQTTSNDSGSMPSNNPNSGQTNDNQTPPEKPDGNSTINDNNSTNNENSVNDNGTSDNSVSTNDSQTPPEKPDGNGQIDSQMTLPDDNSQTTNTTVSAESGNSVLYYSLIIVESLVVSLLIVYLIMSCFNKKTFKETFSNKDKIVIVLLATLLLTGLLTYGSSKLPLNQTSSESSNTTYTAAQEITEETNITSGTYKSTTKDENVILVDGDVQVNLSNIKVTKSGDSDGGDNTSFYGTNSAIIAKNKSNLTIKNASIKTNASGANGVFSYGGSATTNNSSSDGTTVNISDSKITTTKDNSGGIMTTGGGIMNATNLKIKTSGTSSAAIRTDRGGGKVTVNKGTYITKGKGSPAVYSTANVKVKNASLTSKTSEGIVIEGKNSVTLKKVTLTDNNTELNGQSTTYKNIFLYQSMSGDADSGVASFKAKNSTITTNYGDTFYVTNTKAKINLTNNTITNNDSDGNFLRIKKDSWGTDGSNGGEVTLNLINQKSSGNIVVDSISTLDMNLSNNSYYEGSINSDNSAKEINLTIDEDSRIKLTDNSYVTTFNDSNDSYSNIDFNGYKLYVNGKAIN